MPPQYIFPFPLLDPPFTAAYAQTDAPASPGKTGACRPSKSRYPAPPKMHQHPPPHTTPFREKRKNTHRLQPLLNLRVQRPPLDRNHRRRLGVVRDRRPALGAEPPVHGVAAVGRALPLLDGARGGEFVFGDYDDEGWKHGEWWLVWGFAGRGVVVESRGGVVVNLGAREQGSSNAVAYPCRGCCGVGSWRGGGVGAGAPGALSELARAGASFGNGREALGMELELELGSEKEAITYSTSTPTGAGSHRSGRSR